MIGSGIAARTRLRRFLIRVGVSLIHPKGNATPKYMKFHSSCGFVDDDCTLDGLFARMYEFYMLRYVELRTFFNSFFM